MSTYTIAELFGVCASTVQKWLRKYKIKTRIPITYQVYPFSGNLVEKAYLIGFRLGDLTVTKMRRGQRMFASVETSHPAMAQLMHELFDKYAKVGASPRKVIGPPYWEWTGKRKP